MNTINQDSGNNTYQASASSPPNSDRNQLRLTLRNTSVGGRHQALAGSLRNGPEDYVKSSIDGSQTMEIDPLAVTDSLEAQALQEFQKKYEQVNVNPLLEKRRSTTRTKLQNIQLRRDPSKSRGEVDLEQSDGPVLAEGRSPTFKQPSFEEFLQLLKYDSDFKNLKDFIQGNFRDCELIDYDYEHRLAIRENSNFSYQELDQEFANDSQRVWKFLAEHVILRDSLILNKHQQFLKYKSKLNYKNKQMTKMMAQQMAKEQFKAQLKKNEMLVVGGSNASMIMGSEEIEFQKTNKFLQEQLIAYYREMNARGYISMADKKFLKQGVVFKPIKLAVFGMRPEEIEERELFIKNGKFYMLTGRPQSGSSKNNESLYSFGSTKKKSPSRRVYPSKSPDKRSEEEYNQKSGRSSKTKGKKQVPVHLTKSQREEMARTKSMKALREKYSNAQSPTKKLIEEMESRIHEFDINRVWKWNQENIRKYKSYVERFESSEVMFNMMLLDKQIQDLESNYKMIRSIRDNEKNLSKLIHFLKEYFHKVNTQSDEEDEDRPPSFGKQTKRHLLVKSSRRPFASNRMATTGMPKSIGASTGSGWQRPGRSSVLKSSRDGDEDVFYESGGDYGTPLKSSSFIKIQQRNQDFMSKVTQEAKLKDRITHYFKEKVKEHLPALNIQDQTDSKKKASPGPPVFGSEEGDQSIQNIEVGNSGFGTTQLPKVELSKILDSSQAVTQRDKRSGQIATTSTTELPSGREHASSDPTRLVSSQRGIASSVESKEKKLTETQIKRIYKIKADKDKHINQRMQFAQSRNSISYSSKKNQFSLKNNPSSKKTATLLNDTNTSSHNSIILPLGVKKPSNQQASSTSFDAYDLRQKKGVGSTGQLNSRYLTHNHSKANKIHSTSGGTSEFSVPAAAGGGINISLDEGASHVSAKLKQMLRTNQKFNQGRESERNISITKVPVGLPYAGSRRKLPLHSNQKNSDIKSTISTTDVRRETASALSMLHSQVTQPTANTTNRKKLGEVKYFNKPLQPLQSSSKRNTVRSHMSRNSLQKTGSSRRAGSRMQVGETILTDDSPIKSKAISKGRNTLRRALESKTNPTHSMTSLTSKNEKPQVTVRYKNEDANFIYKNDDSVGDLSHGKSRNQGGSKSNYASPAFRSQESSILKSPSALQDKLPTIDGPQPASRRNDDINSLSKSPSDLQKASKKILKQSTDFSNFSVARKLKQKQAALEPIDTFRKTTMTNREGTKSMLEHPLTRPPETKTIFGNLGNFPRASSIEKNESYKRLASKLNQKNYISFSNQSLIHKITKQQAKILKQRNDTDRFSLDKYSVYKPVLNSHL